MHFILKLQKSLYPALKGKFLCFSVNKFAIVTAKVLLYGPGPTLYNFSTEGEPNEL